MRPRDWVSAGANLCALAIAIFALGGAPRWSQGLVALLLAIALISHSLSRRVFARVSPLAAFLGTAVALTALQLIPLPHGVLDHLDPIYAGLRDNGSAVLELSAWNGATLDASGSLRALAFFLILVGVAVVCLRMATTERGRYRVLASVGASCGLVSIVVGIHKLFGITSLYGFYTPSHASPPLLGPLLNENHLGCLTAMGAIVAAGLVMYSRQRAWMRVAWISILGACGMVTLATLSRGATLGLVVGMCVTAGVLVRQRLSATGTPLRHRANFLTSSLPIGIVAACAVIFVLYASGGGVADQISRTTLHELHEPRSKFAAWHSAMILIEESPWVGVGRGGFESSFTRVHPASAFSTFSHVENEYVQAVVDWGIPGALLLGVVALWLVVTAFRKWRDGPLAAAGLGAIAAVMLQSNVDFGVELLGIAVPITAIAATLTYVPMREAQGRRLTWARALRASQIAALLLASALLLSSVTATIDEDHQLLLDKHHLTLKDLRGPLGRHPLDYFGYALAAQIMIGDGDRRAITVLNHALSLHPTHAGLHLMAAHQLFNAGYVQQATIEYSAALHATRSRREIISEIVARFPVSLAVTAIPADDPKLAETVAILEEMQRPDIASAWLKARLDLRAGDLKACQLLFGLATSHSDLESASVANRSCSKHELSNDARLALARALLVKKGQVEVLELLDDVETWRGRIDLKIEGWLTLCDTYESLGNLEEAKRCLHRLDASGYITGARVGEILRRLERIAKVRSDHDLPSGSGSATSVPK